jgi:quercetin dioxygenase-like cupin family protein
MKTLLCVILAVGAPALLRAESPSAAEGYQPVIKVTPLLRSGETVAGQPIVYPKVANPEVTAVRVIIPPGAQTGWHRHPFPCYGYILAGNLTVEMEGGKSVALTAGQALIESVNVLHNGRNTGPTPVELVMFVTGEKGRAFTVPAATPK